MAKKGIVLTGIISIMLFYAPVLFLTEDTMFSLTREDGFYECLGALLFFLASIIFLFDFSKSKNRNLLFLLFALAFFFAAGEEIGWGQRILNFDTPAAIAAVNAQKEFTVHNLDVLQHVHSDRGIPSLVKNLWSFNHLFILFWTVYCILVPMANRYSGRSRSLFLGMRFPIISLWFGVLFLFNEIMCKTLESFVATGRPYLLPIWEIKETLWALLVFLAAVYFYPFAKSQEVV